MSGEARIREAARAALPEIQRRYDAWDGTIPGAGLCFSVAVLLVDAINASGAASASYYSAYPDDHALVQVETDDELWLLDIPFELYETRHMTLGMPAYTKRAGHRFSAADLTFECIVRPTPTAASVG